MEGQQQIISTRFAEGAVRHQRVVMGIAMVAPSAAAEVVGADKTLPSTSVHILLVGTAAAGSCIAADAVAVGADNQLPIGIVVAVGTVLGFVVAVAVHDFGTVVVRTTTLG
jgi:hypothetical protein